MLVLQFIVDSVWLICMRFPLFILVITKEDMGRFHWGIRVNCGVWPYCKSLHASLSFNVFSHFCMSAFSINRAVYLHLLSCIYLTHYGSMSLCIPDWASLELILYRCVCGVFVLPCLPAYPPPRLSIRLPPTPPPVKLFCFLLFVVAALSLYEQNTAVCLLYTCGFVVND